MITGIAPSSVQARTVAAPMPFAPPVITITLSLSCKSIEVGCVQSENLSFFSRRKIMSVAFDDVLYLRIRAGKQTHRPIGSKHQAIDSKSRKDQVEIGPEVLRRPLLPIGLDDHSR